MSASNDSKVATPSISPDHSLHQLLGRALGKESTDTPMLEDARGLESLLAYHCADTQTSRRIERCDAATWTLVDTTLQDVRQCLQAHSISFVVLKGAALSALYPTPSLRRLSDLDILVDPQQLQATRAALTAQGWSSVVTGRYAESYLQEEGSCWQARRAGSAVVEVHFRFWGSVPSTLTDRVIAEAAPNATGDLIPAPMHSLLIAAAHWWRQPHPRRATDLLDAALLLQHHGPDSFAGLTSDTELCGQHLPVCLALYQLRPVLDQHWLTELATQLKSLLRPRERALLEQMHQTGSDSISWAQVRLAMLLSRRPSRAGWRSVWRRLWPHSGVLEQRIPANSSWARQRLLTAVRALQRGSSTR